MFLARRPSPIAIDRFLRDSHDRPTSYGPVGLVKGACPDCRVDEEVVVIGHGREDFERARSALMTWKQCDVGWLQVFPQRTPVEVGTVVAVLIRHLRFWPAGRTSASTTIPGSVGRRNETRHTRQRWSDMSICAHTNTDPG